MPVCMIRVRAVATKETRGAGMHVGTLLRVMFWHMCIHFSSCSENCAVSLCFAAMTWMQLLLISFAVDPLAAADAISGNVQEGETKASHTAARLQIAADAQFPTFELAGGETSMLIADGKTAQGFECSSSTSALAKDLPSMDFRRLSLSLLVASSASSMWTNLLGESGTGEEQQLDALWLTKARVSTSGGDELLDLLTSTRLTCIAVLR